MTPANDNAPAITSYQKAWAKQALPGYEHRHRTTMNGFVVDLYQDEGGDQCGVIHDADGAMQVIEAAFAIPGGV